MWHLPFDKTTDVPAINQLLKHASRQEFAGIMDYSDEPLVSSDFIHDAHSLVIDSLADHERGAAV